MVGRNFPIFILAGGFGSRLSDETQVKPKPMVEIGELPILLHIMRYYYKFGFDDFVICAGYRSWDIKSYFLSYQFHNENIDIDHREGVQRGLVNLENQYAMERWRVRVVDTGMNCQTGGRLARAFDQIQKVQSFENFGVTYGDGLSDVNLDAELDFHSSHGKIGTVLGVHPMARFGYLSVDSNDTVTDFMEKSKAHVGIINGGFFLFKKEFRKYLEGDENCVLEQGPLVNLSRDGQLKVHRHLGFWHPMDTLRDKNFLQGLWDSKKAPWI